MAKYSIVTYYFVVYVFLIFVTTLYYGFIINASANSIPKPFERLGDGFFLHLSFALSILLTSPLPDIGIGSSLGLVIYDAILISTFILVTIFFALFSTALSAHGGSVADKIKADFNEMIQKVEERKKLLLEHAKAQNLSTVQNSTP